MDPLQRGAPARSRLIKSGPQRPGRCLRLAAWQFLVKPPRIDNKPQLGVWVRIHFDFGVKAVEEGAAP